MTQEDQVFVANVVVTDPTQETMALSVINWLINATMELNAIAKICKDKGFHAGHHFIPMAMEVHNALGRDMDHFIKSVLVFSIIDNWEVIILVFLHSIFQATC